MTTFKYTFPTNQSSCKKCNSYSSELYYAPFTKNVQRGSWGGQFFLEEPQHTESLLLSPEAATHIPGPRWSYAACAWIIHWHSSPVRLLLTAPWETATHTAGAGEVLCRPRLTLFWWTILLLSANHDPVTYRPNINNSGSISPRSFGNLNRPPSTALLHKTNGSDCSCS